MKTHYSTRSVTAANSLKKGKDTTAGDRFPAQGNYSSQLKALLSSKQFFELENIQIKKAQHQKLTETHARMLSASDEQMAKNVFQESAFSLPRRDTWLEKSFASGEVALSRTLLHANDSKVIISGEGMSRRPMYKFSPIQKEIRTRSDRLSHGPTIVTSSTLIQSSLKIRTVSDMDSDLINWMGMPSLIYMTSARPWWVSFEMDKPTLKATDIPADRLLNKKFGMGYESFSNSTLSIKK